MEIGSDAYDYRLYLRKLKIQIFCRCSAHMEENETNCILSAAINHVIPRRVYTECIYVFKNFCQNFVLIGHRRIPR